MPPKYSPASYLWCLCLSIDIVHSRESERKDCWELAGIQYAIFTLSKTAVFCTVN